ncbi:MAG TPA: phosphoglycerate kinase [Smithella sp.]|nr:phosphoglycerate kinase [Smithella sp.]HOE32882.1 phosphoglycerate kinase [Smithella sp.]HOG10373.1 phosphoglycerate kinase [Smithella sp.]HOO36177.1 phosphoglycerate kinase [Smithella sp.]HOS14731.1 phosphoglycerate kinase [Smithella sp.]
MKYIDQIDMKGKRVFLRVDFNVPMDKEGNVTSDKRVRASIPTITYALEKGAKLIVASHLGRPKGKRVAEMSLKPVVKVLSDLLKKEVLFLEDCVGPVVEQGVARLQDGQIILLENLRFQPGEDKNDAQFAKQLAALCDVYIDDAFAVSHRAAASNSAITEFVPVCAAGFLLKNEVEYFKKAMVNPAKPLAAIIGGAKVSDKIGLLENLIEKVDKIIIGGGMAFTFLRAAGYETGKSLCEEDMLDTARKIVDKAKQKNVQFLLPVDAVIAQAAEAQAEARICGVQDIPKEWIGLDIGPATIALFSEALKGVKTVIWNGPMGMFELAPFSKGTFQLAQAVADSGALSILGGGDTDTAIKKAGLTSKMSYISTGGGAFLEWLEGKTLPGIAALEK